MRTLARALMGPGHKQIIQTRIIEAVEALSPSELKMVFIFQSNAVENIYNTIATSIRLEHPKSGDERYLMDDLPEVTFAGPVVGPHWFVPIRRCLPKIRRQKSTRFVRRFCLRPCTALHRAEFICGQFAPMTVVHCMMRLSP